MEDSEQFDEELYTKTLIRDTTFLMRSMSAGSYYSIHIRYPVIGYKKSLHHLSNKWPQEMVIYQHLILEHVASYSYLCDYAINNVL